MESKRFTEGQVQKIINAFLQHIADHWDFYKTHLSHLRRTMMFYNEFAYGIRFLPENENYAIEFNPRDPLLDDLQAVFGERYSEETKDLVYGAWPLRVEGRPWRGYEEPTDDSPDSCYRGFTTVRELPEQKEFLDSVRNHPRVKLGIRLMEKEFLVVKKQERGRKRAQLEWLRLLPRLVKLHNSKKSKQTKMKIERLEKRMSFLTERIHGAQYQ